MRISDDKEVQYFALSNVVGSGTKTYQAVKKDVENWKCCCLDDKIDGEST